MNMPSSISKTEGKEGPYKASTIILRGGPKDGTTLVITDALARLGHIKVPLMSDPLAFGGDHPSLFSTTKVGLYQRKTKYAGEPGTCEFRTWDEWHWKGAV